jgi:hypothetical protein
MDEFQRQVLMQALYYGLFGVLVALMFAFLLRGFIYPYIRVKASLGKLVLVKVRGTLRDYYKVGDVQDKAVTFKKDDNVIRIPIQGEKNAFYRSLGVTWIDVNEENSSIIYRDITDFPAKFDAKFYDNLFVWALTRPNLMDKKLVIIIILGCLCLVFAGAAAYLSFSNYSNGLETIGQVKGLYNLTLCRL